MPRSLPWTTVDFSASPAAYLQAVLDYSFEGNVEVNFKPALNKKREWFHAPWLHYGPNGRDFVSGLTRERDSQRYELSALQTEKYRNFAVGFYNDLGGFTIGQVWRNPAQPDVSVARFPEGTVSFKLLFTTAPEESVSYLKGSPEWIADIDRLAKSTDVKKTKVRLLQIDVSVKDWRSNAGGWIFGTFHYDAQMPGNDPWKKLRPLCLVWGNDPLLTETSFKSGSRPTQSWVNPESPIIRYRENPPAGITPPNVMGYAGRGNGPVDNPVSSCLSCHMTAQIPATSPMTPPTSNDQQVLRWFRNLPPGTPFDPASVSLDFSLQLGVGIQNFQRFQQTVTNMGGFHAVNKTKNSFFMLQDVNAPILQEDTGLQQYKFSRDPEDQR